MNTDTALVTVPQDIEIRLGSLAVARPSDMIVRASEVATALAQVVKDRKLSRAISGREYVYVEGWATMGAMIGILPREVGVIEHDNGDFEATVELIRVNDGAVVGQGSAIVGYDEPTWKARPRYAKRSMSITRATGKAYRLGFSWIMALAGYAPTPAEEMDGITDVHADVSDAEFRKLTSATEERAAQPRTASPPRRSAWPAPGARLRTGQFNVWADGSAEIYRTVASNGKPDMVQILRADLKRGQSPADERGQSGRRSARRSNARAERTRSPPPGK